MEDLGKLAMKIAKILKAEFKDNLLSVSLHGIVPQNNTHKDSDIDFFLVFEKIKYNELMRLKELKMDLENKYKVELSLNIQKHTEMPEYRKKYFYHKNRYALFLHEANKIDKVLIGENLYKTGDLPTQEEITLEAIRIVNSFAYFLRKFIVNSNIDFAYYEAVRYVVMVTQYANSIKGLYPTKTYEATELFKDNFKEFKHYELPVEYMKLKKHEIEPGDKNQVIKKALSFLEDIDEYLFSIIN
jgi:predicted nucleotidyltransferase